VDRGVGETVEQEKGAHPPIPRKEAKERAENERRRQSGSRPKRCAATRMLARFTSTPAKAVTPAVICPRVCEERRPRSIHTRET